MTYKILSTRTTPDGAFFTSVEYNIDGQIYTTEVVTNLPNSTDVIVESIKNFARSEKYRMDALANLPTIEAALPLNIETGID
jgi:hypothetical protein